MIIPEPKFYLKDIKSSESTLISMQVKYEKIRIVLSTGNKIHPTEWDFTSQRTKVSKKNLANQDINMWLDKMSSELKSIIRTCLIENIFPNQEIVTQKLKENLNMIIKSQPVIEKKIELNFFDFIEQFINEAKNSKAIATVKSYEATLQHLKSYSSICSKKFDFDDITIQWRSNFIKYLQSCGLARCSEGKHIKIIKLVMGEAVERGLTKNIDFKSKSFYKPIEDVPKIFLTKDEIKKIYDLDLSWDKLKDITRDFFIISCHTALRYSDFVDLKEENIKDGFIEIITKKTGEKVILPIATLVKNIFEKYNYNLPKASCNQVFNKTLKCIGRLAKINDPFTVTKTIGGLKKTITYQKWELITAHTGRRTFISNGILSGLNTASLMICSGHKSLDVFQGYIKVNQQQNATALADHTFFQ